MGAGYCGYGGGSPRKKRVSGGDSWAYVTSFENTTGFNQSFGPSFGKPLGASFKVRGATVTRVRHAPAPHAHAHGAHMHHPGAAPVVTRRGRSMGANPPPPPAAANAGLSADQWAGMTPDQQSTFLRADQQQQERIVAAVSSGITSTISQVFTTIQNQQQIDLAAMHEKAATDRAKIAAQNASDLAKIAAARDVALAQAGQTAVSAGAAAAGGGPAAIVPAASGGMAPAPAAAPPPVTPAPSGGGKGLLAIGLAIVVALLSGVVK
jgi:hypothetical protein